MGAAAWEIRWLTPADAAAFQRLRLAGLRASPSAFGSSYEEEKDRSLAVIEARLAPSADQGVLGAFARSQLVGMLGIRRQDGLKTRHRMALWGVYVEPAFRGQGIAQALLAQAVAFARQVPGAVQIHLSVNAANASAIRLYEQAGFRAYGTEPAALLVDGELHDELLMQHRLQPPSPPAA
ncbi:GNAT family N-acetyltransferase [Comamonas sediminis]|uniref:N-acetyltransferase family protein n=1 Tax=Comamonas sediminis TaxID=1783360 RepID=A0ABV4AYX7_9BURK